ncbi:MAG TPA: IS701 family transposase [Chloroflexota bacterium]|nr:IS701 family transposase [Chloroflexota bacterium]
MVAEAETAPLEIAAAEAAIQGIAAGLRPRFRRGAAHQHAVAYVRGLLSDVERKNGWQLAEYGGYSHPRTIQRVLDRSRWDADAVREDLRAYVVEHLGDPAGVLVVDETGFLKKGTHSCGVARQYSGTAGRIENCQIGVFLGYSSAQGRAGIDRELYLPREWVADAERRAAAGVPDSVAFRTKPQLALGMIERALEAGVPARWVVADEVYGSDSKFRRALEERDQAYVVAVKSTEKPSTWPPYGVPGQVAVAALRAGLEPGAWHRLSCGEGAQGERLYDWAYVPLRPALREGWVHGVLFRRSLPQADEVAYYLVYAPEATRLDAMGRAAGSRWAIEDVFKLAKGQVGLDHYEVRSWAGWYRHMTLALLALALLATSTSKRGTR